MAKTAQTKALKPEEEDARRIVAMHLDAIVEQHDYNLAPRQPDLEILYQDGRRGLVEVVLDVHRRRVAQAAALLRRWKVPPPPGLTESWFVIVGEGADIRPVGSLVPDMLLRAQAQGRTHIRATSFPQVDPLAFELGAIGVERVWSYPLNKETGVRIAIMSAPYGWFQPPADALNTFCEKVLAREVDVAEKLRDSDCQERHAFIVATSGGDLPIYGTLMHERDEETWPVLPTTPPTLPDGIDQVWVRGRARVLRWSASTGWVEVADATSAEQ